MVLNTETEQKIVASAEKLFYQKGKAGTSMQDIADDAGINRTLLNYYFRTKDQLFEAVFRNALSKFVPELARLTNSERRFREYLPDMIRTIIDGLLENPQIPIFVLQELSSNPERIPEVIRDLGVDPDQVVKKMEKESKREDEAGYALDQRQMLLNVLSLCIFPFAARPIVTEVLFGGDDQEYIQAMKQRRQLLPDIFSRFFSLS